ncbi:MAG: radical SAM protein [bacterium]|nr:radical SAM protein [Candidatus Sumerlaeota bacterium]
MHRQLAADRARVARAMLRACNLCAHRCGADRTSGPAGVCKCDAQARLFSSRVDWAGEQELVPTLVFNLSGCNMACDYCITGTQSQDGCAGEPLDIAHVNTRFSPIREDIASFAIEGGEPTVHLPGALEIASIVPQSIPLVWKTNGYASIEALELLEEVVDVFLPDYKFGNDACATRIAKTPNYTAAIQQNLLWARDHLPHTIVRHLLLPGHLDCCCIPMLKWLKQRVPQIELSLVTGFMPLHRARRHAELGGMVSTEEAACALEEARARNIRLAPWSMETRSKDYDGPPGRIWIGRDGRICVNFASAGVISCLKRLAPEIDIQFKDI